MSLQINLQNFATRLATEFKSLRTLINNNAGNLSALTTTEKSNLVAAINEIVASIEDVATGAGAINDATTTTSSTWSSTKTAAAIAALIDDDAESGTAATFSIDKVLALIEAGNAAVKDELQDGAGEALNTFKEFSTALGDDPDFAATTAANLANRVRFDASQSLNTTQKAQACANIGIGDPETDLVATFNAGLS